MPILFGPNVLDKLKYCGENVTIRNLAKIEHPHEVEIDDNCYIFDYAFPDNIDVNSIFYDNMNIHTYLIIICCCFPWMVTIGQCSSSFLPASSAPIANIFLDSAV